LIKRFTQKATEPLMDREANRDFYPFPEDMPFYSLKPNLRPSKMPQVESTRARQGYSIILFEKREER